MEESILSPIGLMLGVIAASANSIRTNLVFGLKHQSVNPVRKFGLCFFSNGVKQEGFYKKLHLPIHSRSPPLLACS